MNSTLTGQWPAVLGEVEAVRLRACRVRDEVEEEAPDVSRRCAALRAELAAYRDSEPPSDSAPGGQETGLVLLVEDEDAVARTTTRALERHALLVRRVASGEEACALLTAEAWQAIVLDLELGAGCSGLAVAREARRRTTARVVLWSGRLVGSELEEARVATGAHNAVAKGDDLTGLLRAIGVLGGGTSRRT